MKKTLCLLLALIFAFTMPLGAFALDGPNQADITIDPVGDTEIDEDTAAEVIPEMDSTVLVYCRSGNRSKTASSALAELGYTNIYEFGGINTWPYETES